jgi:uncharacterized protein (UPF0216 family)
MLRQEAKEVADKLEKKVILRHLMDDWKVSREDILLFSVVFVENLRKF